MKRTILFALATFAAAALTHADVIKTKDGKTLEGTITGETAEAWNIEIQVTPKIKDFKTVKKSDVLSVVRTTPDEKEAAELLKMTTRDMMSAGDYQKGIMKLEEFLKKYPASKKKADVEKVLKVWQEEMKRVLAGEQRIGGEWISAQEMEWNAYSINARKLLKEMTDLIAQRKPMEAYRKFVELESTGAASMAYLEGVEQVKKILGQIDAELSLAAQQQPQKFKERKEQLASSDPATKATMEGRLKADEQAIRMQIADDRRKKLGVPAYNPFDLRTITEAIAGAAKERKRLELIDVAKLKEANERFLSGLKDMSQKAYLSAKSNFELAAKHHTKDAGVKARIDEARRMAEASKRTGAK